jgi:hypothetical protein
MALIDDMERLARRKDLRSADRANIVRMVQQMRHGQGLTEQERQNLWAYFVRYRVEGGEPRTG